jgi:hypothetical protein
MATKGTKQRTRINRMVYKGKALQMQDTVRPPIRSLPMHKRHLLTLCMSVGLLALIVLWRMLAGDGSITYVQRPEWQMSSRIVVDQGLIWEVDE